MGAAAKGQPGIANPGSVLQGLLHAHKQLGDVPTIADQSTTMETFDLGNLEEEIEKYEELWQKYNDDGLRNVVSVVTQVQKLGSLANETTRSAEDHLAKKLPIIVLLIQGRTMVHLKYHIRQARLLNVEKRFGFTEARAVLQTETEQSIPAHGILVQAAQEERKEATRSA